MKNLALLGLLPLFLISALASSAEAVPVTTSFTARIADGSGAITGNVSMTFKVYDASTGGTLQWEETHASVSANAGLVFVELGSIDSTNNGLDETVFTGDAMFMEVTVNSDVQSPRVPILAVPYAIHAALADNVVNENDPIYAASPAAGITGNMITDWNSDDTLSEATVDTYANNNGYAAGGHDHAGVYALDGHNHSGVYAPAVHTHAATNITSGILSTSRYSAYADLSAEGYLSNNGSGDLLTRSQADSRYALSSHSQSTATITNSTTNSGVLFHGCYWDVDTFTNQVYGHGYCDSGYIPLTGTCYSTTGAGLMRFGPQNSANGDLADNSAVSDVARFYCNWNATTSGNVKTLCCRY